VCSLEIVNVLCVEMRHMPRGLKLCFVSNDPNSGVYILWETCSKELSVHFHNPYIVYVPLHKLKSDGVQVIYCYTQALKENMQI